MRAPGSSAANVARRRKLGLSPIVTSASAPSLTKTLRCITMLPGYRRWNSGLPKGEPDDLRKSAELREPLEPALPLHRRPATRHVPSIPGSVFVSSASPIESAVARAISGLLPLARISRVSGDARPVRNDVDDRIDLRGARRVHEFGERRPATEWRPGHAAARDHDPEVDPVQDRAGVHPRVDPVSGQPLGAW